MGRGKHTLSGYGHSRHGECKEAGVYVLLNSRLSKYVLMRYAERLNGLPGFAARRVRLSTWSTGARLHGWLLPAPPTQLRHPTGKMPLFLSAVAGRGLSGHSRQRLEGGLGRSCSKTWERHEKREESHSRIFSGSMWSRHCSQATWLWHLPVERQPGRLRARPASTSRVP